METTDRDCAMRQNGIACGLPLVLLPSGQLYCRRCNAVRVVETTVDESGRKRLRVVLTDAEKASMGLHGPSEGEGRYTASEALRMGLIPADGVLAAAVREHGDRWMKSLTG